MRPVLVGILLLLPALAGCFGGGDGGLDPSAADGPGEVPTLPEGLEMEGAEVVEYNETSVVWRWRGTAGPGAFTDPFQGNPAGPVASTAFDIPMAQGVGVIGTLTWQSAAPSALGLQIVGPGDAPICTRNNLQSTAMIEVSCGGLVEPTASSARGRVDVEPWLAGEEVSFELLMEVTVGDGGPGPTRPIPPAEANPPGGPHVVIGLADTGINPYHEAYRDDSPEAYLHPSTYLDGYPEDAVAINLSLDAPSYVDAVAADADVWTSLQRGQLYWIPGTKIIGGYAPDGPRDGEGTFCRVILDCNGHGSMTASRAAGNAMSLCEDCKLVEVQAYKRGVEWMVEQTWIDLIVDEWCYDHIGGGRLGDREESDALHGMKPIFQTAGNGASNLALVGGYPTAAQCFDSALPNAITVGGYNDGQVSVGANTMPHIAADMCTNAPRHDSMNATSHGCGTSLSTPYAAGAGGVLVLEARRILRDDAGGVHDQVLARGAPGVVEAGPLADGELTIDEFKRLLFTTADPRPGPDEHSGPACNPVCFGDTLIEWRLIPEGVPQYYFIGYGGINNDTLEHALQVLRGQEPMPERPVEDVFFALDQEVRKALVEVDP